MGKPYSMDLRERVLKDCDSGLSPKDVAKKFSVSAAWVYSLLQRRRDTGSFAPQIDKPGPPWKLAPYEQEVRQAVADHPYATLLELVEILSPHVRVSDSTLCDF